MNGSMGKAARAGLVGLGLVLGVGLTAGAARFGVAILDGALGRGCRRGCPLQGERMRLETIATATETFVVDRGRCPSGAGELAAEGYLDERFDQGGPVSVSCSNATEAAGRSEPEVHVAAPGPDGRFGTADDLSVTR